MTLRPPPFPIRIEELTPEFLSEALGATVADYTSTTIGAERGMLGSIHLLELRYVDQKEALGAPMRVVAKMAAQREGALASARRARVHERELRFFDELLAETPVAAPQNYGTWYDPDTAQFLLLQSAIDVDPAVDQVKGLTITQARQVLAAVAPMHARWWGDTGLKQTEWLPRLDGEGRMTNLTTLAAAGWGPLCDALGDELTSAERALGPRFPDRLAAALSTIANLPSTFVHSDLRADNLLFSPDGSAVTIVDWQGCGLGPPSFDVAYFLSQSLTVADRRTHETELINFYLGQLSTAGMSLEPEQFSAGYKESMFFGLAVACALPLISDPDEPRARALMSVVARRSLAALDDHGLLW